MCETNFWNRSVMYEQIGQRWLPSDLGRPGQVVAIRDPARVQFIRPPSISCWLLWDAVASAATLLLLTEETASARVWEILFPAFGHPILCPQEAP